jgi:isoamylase
MKQLTFTVSKGHPYPYGVHIQEHQINFCLVSKHAKQLALHLFDRSSGVEIAKIAFDPTVHKTGDIWHLALFSAEDLTHLVYAYTIDEGSMLLDPYAKAVNSSPTWGVSEQQYAPRGLLAPPAEFDFENITPPRIPLEDLVLYEMHVRGFTQHASSAVKQPGKFLGIIEKIPHLLELGVNAIELLPIHEFNECEYLLFHPHSDKKLCNYWGYSTVNFFSSMNRYAASSDPHAAIHEFKTMVKELHRHGIELILDVVFNHTAEGDEKGCILSFKGLDAKTYYMIDAKGHYLNYTGCGNTFNANHPVALEYILAALRYWVVEMHVDGFRFDLASALNRGTDGRPHAASCLIKAIGEDPCLAGVKLIAEPWDASGLYQLGIFSKENSRWAEWNDKYRDGVRRFIKGTPGSIGEFTKKICGSEDLFYGRAPSNSINFITAHDGFTLADLVSYNHKHNMANGEQNRDGSSHNESWNCGTEGSTEDPEILQLRARQIRNLHLALMVSQGVPMLLMGDEYRHSKKGNNNTWCQDNELNWFLWDQLAAEQEFYQFYRFVIHFRKRHPHFRRKTFLKDQDIDWHGTEPFKPNWESTSQFIAFTLKSAETEAQLYIAFNSQQLPVKVTLPPPPQFKSWRWIVNTSNPPPQDCYEAGEGPLQTALQLEMQGYSALLLKSL